MPLYILGSSLFGARLAAQLGLPYAFASHFAPNALQDAVAIYRREFKPSAQLDAPHVIAGVNVIAADSAAEAQAMFRDTKRARVSLFFGNGREFSDDEADMILDSPQGQHVPQMMTYSAVGTPDAVVEYLDEFTAHADADELIVAHQSTGTAEPAALRGAAGRDRGPRQRAKPGPSDGPGRRGARDSGPAPQPLTSAGLDPTVKPSGCRPRQVPTSCPPQSLDQQSLHPHSGMVQKIQGQS